MSTEIRLATTEIFCDALRPGPADAPRVLAVMLSSNDDMATSQSEFEEVACAVSDEFPCVIALRNGGTITIDEREAWVRALRWCLHALSTYRADEQNSQYLFSSILSALWSLGLDTAETLIVAPFLETSEIENLLLTLISSAEPKVWNVQMHDSALRKHLSEAVTSNDFTQLARLLRDVMPEPAYDVGTAVLILWQTHPGQLAGALSEKNDVLLFLWVCHVLNDYAPQFSLSVPSPALKFVALSWLEINSRNKASIDKSVGVFSEILLQVRSSPSWPSWMSYFFRFPQGESLASKAFSNILTLLDEACLNDFFSAIELDYSSNGAEVVSFMFKDFLENAPPERIEAATCAAQTHWAKWDYGRGSNLFMSKPVTCALDTLVSRYFSLLPAKELGKIKVELESRSENLESEWFQSVSDLWTTRSRVLSILRLVKNGCAYSISGKYADLFLPFPCEEHYFQVRYRYD